MELIYFHPSSNNASIFWLEDRRQSNYRHIRNNSDIEAITNFLRDKEWTSRRGDTSWSLVANVNRNKYIVRVYGAEGGLIGPCRPGFLCKRGLQHFYRDPRTKMVLKDHLCFFRCLSFYLFNNTSHCKELLELFFPGQTKTTYNGITLSI